MTPALAPPNEGQIATQEHPAGELDEQPSPYGERNEQLPEQLVNALKDLVKKFQQQEQYIRRMEVLADRLKRFYERGYQHVYCNQRTGLFVQATAGATVPSNGQQIQCPNYIDDYNIFQPYLRVLQAILTQNPPGIDFRPINPNKSEDIEAAETAEGYRKMFDRSNDAKEIQTQIVRMMGVSGRTVIWTRTEANAQKFGLNRDGEPKRMEISTVHGTLESKVPILAKCLEDALYCFLFDDIDVRQAKTQHPDFATKIKANTSGLGESNYERSARLGVLQGTRDQAQMGDAFSHLVTEMNCWIRPASFTDEAFEDAFEEIEPNEDGSVMTIKDKLLQLFPNGVHVVFEGDTYVGSWGESMDDHIVVGFPYVGDGMFRMALMDPMVVVTDRFNDNMNAAAEVWDFGWPSTWVAADDTEFEAIGDQEAAPYAFRQFKSLPKGEKLQDRVYREPNPALPANFMEFIELLEGPLAQFMIAAPPALFGAAMEDQKTASGYAQARSQAMGQQGLTWAAIQKMMSRMYYQAALCASSNPDHSEEIIVPGDGGSNSTVRLERLTKGKFGCYPDEDSSFPESTSAKRVTLSGVLDKAALNPVLGAQVMSSPDNWKLFATIMGFPELVIPEAVSRDKQVFEIEELLQGAPIPASPEELQSAQVQHAAASMAAQRMGQPEPPPPDPMSMLKPSIMPDELDFHEWEFPKCKEWLSSEACRRELSTINPETGENNASGVLNVKLHALEHQKFMIAQMPPPMAAPAGPPAKDGPPKPGAHPAGPPKPPATPATPARPGMATM